MPSLSPNSIETVFRDESYKAFLWALPQQSQDLEESGFFDLFPDDSIRGYSDFETELYHNYAAPAGRNPGEPLLPGTMAQGRNYWTAIRAEFNEIDSIAAEYLDSVLKLGDFGAKIGEMQAKNYHQARAQYFTNLISYGAITPATLTATGVGVPGGRGGARIYAHYLKGELGSILSEIPKTDAADPDGLAWFSNVSSPHIRANGDTSASYAGKTLGFFNYGSSVAGANMVLNEYNLNKVLLHMENDLPWGPDRKMYSAQVPDTLIVSGNLRAIATEIVDLNEYRQATPNNDKNTLFRGSKVFGIKNIIVNRFLPDNCWLVCAKGHGVKTIGKMDNKYGQVGIEGPVKGTETNIFIDMYRKTWIRQFFAYWSHRFDYEMDICWYAGSLPTTLDGTTSLPVAPTTASLKSWDQ